VRGRVLLTGASGFIGRAAIEPLLRSGFEVHALARRRIESPAAVQWHCVDLFDAGPELDALISAIRPDCLLHFAWYAEPGKYWQAGENVDCLCASLRLLRAFHAAGGRRVAMAGSCAEYDWTLGAPLRETTPRKPATLYGVCKNALQNVLAGYSSQYGLSSAWGRVFIPYGPYEQPVRLVPDVICSILQGRVARCTSGEHIRDFIHVDDAAEAFVALLASDVTGAVNIGSGQGVAVKDVALKIAQRLGRPDLLQLGAIPVRKDEPPALVADVRRLTDEVGFTPRTIDKGLDLVIAWWRKQLASSASGPVGAASQC
jgi:nucleoside-diphosphate-sugar epimerase